MAFVNCVFVYLAFNVIYFETNAKEIVDNTRLLGIEAVHDIKIDKDTVITRNLKLEKRGRAKNQHIPKKSEEEEPDRLYSPFPKEVSPYVEQFKRNMTECLKEVQKNDKRTVKRLSPLKESPVHAECLIACVLKRNDVIVKGKINKGNLISLVRKFYGKDLNMMKKLEKNLDQCIEISVKYKDECSLASQLNDCTNNLMISNKHKVVVNY